MDIYKHKFTQLQAEIFSLLCVRAGEMLSQRDLAKILKVSPTAIANSLKAIKEENLINIEKTKTINFVSLNREERRAIEMKRVENISNIYISGLIGFLEEELPGGTIILFGSYSKGEDMNTSDIDISVIGRKEKNLDLAKFELLLKRKIIIQFYDSLKTIHKNLKESILNGIVLSGSIEL